MKFSEMNSNQPTVGFFDRMCRIGTPQMPMRMP